MAGWLPSHALPRPHRFKGRGGSSGPALFAIFLLLIGLISCAGVVPDRESEVSRIIPDIPFYPQEEFQCGPATLAAVLNYWKVNVSPEEIAREIYSHSAKGTLTVDMVGYAERRGLKARQYRGSLEDLKDRIDSGYPLIVLVDEGFLMYQKNHFVAVVGYGGKGVIVHSGREASKFVPYQNFLRTWGKTRFWTLLITPP